MRYIVLQSLSTPQLLAIRQIIAGGAPASAQAKELAAEVKQLRKHKKELEASIGRGKLIKARQSRLDEAGLDFRVESEADFWLSLSHEQFEFIVRQCMKQKTYTSSASLSYMRIPAVYGNGHDRDAKEVLREALRRRGNGKEA